VLFLTLLIGLTASLVGIGGGVFLVPLFNLLMGLKMREAVGTSLFVIFFIAFTASYSYWRRKLVSWRIGLIMEGGSGPGAFLGSLASHYLPSSLVKIAFIALLTYVAVRMWRREEGGERIYYRKLNVPWLLAIGFAAGFLSGLLGIGGGVVKVPILTILVGLPMHSAVATSEFMIVITTLTGALTHGFLGDIVYINGLLIAPCVIIGSFLGSKLSVRLKRGTLRKVFSVVMGLIALRMGLSLL